MAIHIDQLNTEVIAEPDKPLAGAGMAAETDMMDEMAKIRFAVAESARLEQRTRADAYDD